jgi:hypothetical protein
VLTTRRRKFGLVKLNQFSYLPPNFMGFKNNKPKKKTPPFLIN